MATRNKLERAPEPGEVERARATPLRPVVWMTSVLVWATVVALIVRVPTWASVFLCTVTGLSFLVFLVGYIYLFTHDREVLRAERWRAGLGGAKSSAVPDHQLQSADEDHRVHSSLKPAEVPVTRPEEGKRSDLVGDAAGRTME